jgi:hypothetical protein
MAVDQIIHMLPSMNDGLVAAIGTMRVVWFALMDLVKLGGPEDSGRHDWLPFIHAGVRRSGSSSTTLSRSW